MFRVGPRINQAERFAIKNAQKREKSRACLKCKTDLIRAVFLHRVTIRFGVILAVF